MVTRGTGEQIHVGDKVSLLDLVNFFFPSTALRAGFVLEIVNLKLIKFTT
jgi:hypothetical protein